MKHSFVHCYILLFSLVICSLVVSCHPGGSDQASRLDISLDVQEITLTQLWETIVEEIEIREETAQLTSFRLDTNEQGEIQRVLLLLWGISSANQSTSYLVEINNREHQKLLTVNPDTSNQTLISSHPADYLTEIDKVGLSNIQSNTDGISIAIVDIFSGLDYYSDENYTLLYELNDGNLIPLKRVKFKQEPYIFGMIIDRNAPDGSSYTDQYWFLDKDLAKADIVEYETNP